MAKVFGLHMVRLKPRVKPEDFEKFVKEEVSQWPTFEGMKLYVLKGIRGDREGKYLSVMEFESVEALHRWAPSPEVFTEEAKKFQEVHGEEWERFLTFARVGDIFTDYVVVE